MSNGLTFEILHISLQIFYRCSHDLETLQIYQNKCVLDIEWLAASLGICLLDHRGTIFFQNEHKNSSSRYPRGAENDFRI